MALRVKTETIATLLTVYLLLAFFLPNFYPENQMTQIFTDLESIRMGAEESAFQGVPFLGAINGIKDFIVQSFGIITTVAGLPVLIMVLPMPIYAKIPLLVIGISTYFVVISNAAPLIRGIGNVIPFT